MKVLIDTNVIIDALTSREPWNESAETIFIMAANHMMVLLEYSRCQVLNV